MNYSNILEDLDRKVYFLNSPIWDYKLSGNTLELITMDSIQTLDLMNLENHSCTVRELVEYVNEEGLDFKDIRIVSEETGQEVVDYAIKYNIVHLSTLILK
jgi:hypothetical protein